MIFRLIDDATGDILRSIDAPIHIAQRYVKPGQSLVAGGTNNLMVDDSRLKIEDGQIVRKEGVEDIGGWAGEGAEVTAVIIPEETSPEV